MRLSTFIIAAFVAVCMVPNAAAAVSELLPEPVAGLIPGEDDIPGPDDEPDDPPPPSGCEPDECPGSGPPDEGWCVEPDPNDPEFSISEECRDG